MSDRIHERHEGFRKNRRDINSPFSMKKVIIFLVIIALIVLVGGIIAFLPVHL